MTGVQTCALPIFDRLPAMYTIYIPYISLIYSMYIHKYIHIWRAAYNSRNLPAKNYRIRGFATHGDVQYTGDLAVMSNGHDPDRIIPEMQRPHVI